ncbi:MAG: hypothetical protein KME38_02190 [Spirirestis rafaelensis WJT71-NPBG6]|nr:hypothetical protein [Spirirestis rafaelensis WJT71-NPBG6]
MNYEFPVPLLLQPTQYQPTKLIELASTQPNTKISLPTVDKVLEAIKQGNADKVTPLEWVYCIYIKAQWDEKNPDCCWKTSDLIWNVAINNAWLRHQLLWRLALYYNEQPKDMLAKSLVNSFDVLANSTQVNNLLPVKIIQALRSSKPSQQFAKIACEQLVNRSELLNKIREDLPVWITAFNEFLENIVPHFSTIVSPNKQQVYWLLRCLNEMSVEKQVNAVNYLLTNLSKEVASNHPQLVEWLRFNYRSGEGWYRLSEQARQKLREWIGAINYADFQTLVDLILNRLHLENWEQNQLRKRRKFWADYSNRFERLRILLPQTSLNVIGYELNKDVDLLENDGSDSTEVCIFDFGEWLVVEFFRGRGSETRLLPNNVKNQQLLFNESKLSLKRIRNLGYDRHDHVYLWQVFCPQWLEQKRIQPNSSTEVLQTPTADKLYQREKKLDRWQSDIASLEKEAKAYCEKNGF